MQSHAPKNYICPICIGLKTPGVKNTMFQKGDFIFSNEHITAIINSFFVGVNKGHVIVIPNNHYENIYDIPEKIGHEVFSASQKIAKAMKKAYQCDGITIRQNNEPASDQHAFHYHMHIFPRYKNDNFDQECGNNYIADPKEKADYAKKLIACLV